MTDRHGKYDPAKVTRKYFDHRMDRLIAAEVRRENRADRRHQRIKERLAALEAASSSEASEE